RSVGVLVLGEVGRFLASRKFRASQELVFASGSPVPCRLRSQIAAAVFIWARVSGMQIRFLLPGRGDDGLKLFDEGQGFGLVVTAQGHGDSSAALDIDSVFLRLGVPVVGRDFR